MIHFVHVTVVLIVLMVHTAQLRTTAMCWIATVCCKAFRKYHSSSAAQADSVQKLVCNQLLVIGRRLPCGVIIITLHKTEKSHLCRDFTPVFICYNWIIVSFITDISRL